MLANMFILQSAAIVNYLTSPYTIWFPIVVLAAIVVIVISVLIYMLSGFIGREGIRTWAKIKAYDVLLSFILIIAFMAMASFVFQYNFQSLFNTAGLLPGQCSGSSLQTDLFSVAICDMHQFNQNIVNLNLMLYTISLRLAFVPRFEFNSSAIVPIEGVSVATYVELPSVIGSLSGTALQLLYGAYVISEVQLLLLGASLLLFSLFMSIGLISRMFEVTKSFGGAMIAFGVGLGIVYPLLVCFTYGFVNMQMNANYGAMEAAYATTMVGGIIGIVAAILFTVVASPIFSGLLAALIKYMGLAVIGLTVIPMLNFILVDVFVGDFSKAVGERMSFLSLLTNMI